MISHKFLRSLSVMSGEIFTKMGIFFISLLASETFFNSFINSAKLFSNCKSLRPGVFGEEIFIVIYDTQSEKKLNPSK